MSGLPEGSDSFFNHMKSVYLSEEYITRKAAQDWMSYLTNWNGAEITLGESFTFEAEQPVYGDTSKSLKLTTTVFPHEKLVSCERKQSSKQCIVLKAETETSSESLELMMKAVGLDQMMSKFERASGKPPRIADMNMNTYMKLVTEPSQLLPHSYEYSRTSGFALEAEGQRGGRELVEIKEVTFTYF